MSPELLSKEVSKQFAAMNARLDEIAATLARPQIPDSRTLWTAEQVADYLGVGKRQVAERYSFEPGFPKAVRLPGSARRWVKSEILALPDKWRVK